MPDITESGAAYGAGRDLLPARRRSVLARPLHDLCGVEVAVETVGCGGTMARRWLAPSGGAVRRLCGGAAGVLA